MGYYAALTSGAIMIAYQSRSSLLVTAALLLGIGWAASIQVWFAFDGLSRSVLFFAIESILAYNFFKMSRGRWFPVPLFLAKFIEAIYHLIAGLAGANIFWISVLSNRALDFALFYVIGCGAYRVMVRIFQENDARLS